MTPRRVLVIVTRRIGDVLLATPLVRSLRRAWPDCAIDVLVFKGTEGVLAANPDISRILTVPERPGLLAHARHFARIFRRYDLALSLLAGDRPTVYAWAAGRRRVGLLNDTPKERWKQRLLHQWVPFDNLDTHTVRMHLALAGVLGVEPKAEVVLGWSPRDEERVGDILGADWREHRWAVLHPFPKFNYKKWHGEGWAELARWLSRQGFGILLSGGRDPEEQDYVSGLAPVMPDGTRNLAGALSLPQLAALLARAKLYVGPDTAVTHMAAALGVPTVALFGPSNPVKWGPWPKDFPAGRNPWQRVGSAHVGNVYLIQGIKHCVPCLQEGCGRHVGSYSDCLQELPASRVIEAAEALLADQG